MMITGIVETMVHQRQVMSALYRDPEMERLVAEHEELRATRQRVDEMLNPSGVVAGARHRLGWAVVGAGFTRAIVDPQFAGVPEEDLKTELIRLAHRILD